jgi:hypothetical protein
MQREIKQENDDPDDEANSPQPTLDVSAESFQIRELPGMLVVHAVKELPRNMLGVTLGNPTCFSIQRLQTTLVLLGLKIQR